MLDVKCCMRDVRRQLWNMRCRMWDVEYWMRHVVCAK